MFIQISKSNQNCFTSIYQWILLSLFQNVRVELHCHQDSHIGFLSD